MKNLILLIVIVSTCFKGVLCHFSTSNRRILTTNTSSASAHAPPAAGEREERDMSGGAHIPPVAEEGEERDVSAGAQAPPAADPPKRALCLHGGGFLAHSAFTGMLAAELGKGERVSAEEIKTSLQHFDILSTVSGGTWFTSQLAYSPYFLHMVQEMARRDRCNTRSCQRKFRGCGRI